MLVLDVNTENWEKEVLQSSGLILVEFWHHQCKWCRMTEPIYEELSREYETQVKFTRVNLLESRNNQTLALSFGVRGTPTFIFFCERRPTGMIVGFHPKDSLKQQIENMIDTHRLCLDQSTPLE